MGAVGRIDAHWSRFLGVPTSALQAPGIVVTPHASLHGFHGVWFFVRGRSAVVSAPPERVVQLERSLIRAVAQDLLSATAPRRIVGRDVEEVVGPSYQGWLSAGKFHPTTSTGIRRLSGANTEAIQRFRTSCPGEDWDHGGIDLAVTPVWAVLQRSEIVSLGQLRPHVGGSVDPCLVTHPDHRGRGYGLRLVSAMAENALAQKRLVLYQTLLANTPALSLARRLGFEQYATLVAVRLALPAVSSGR